IVIEVVLLDLALGEGRAFAQNARQAEKHAAFDLGAIALRVDYEAGIDGGPEAVNPKPIAVEGDFGHAGRDGGLVAGEGQAMSPSFRRGAEVRHLDRGVEYGEGARRLGQKPAAEGHRV